MTITLVGSPISPFVRKVQLTLLEKRVDFELDPVNPFDPPPGFRELSPLGRIPALRHGERVVNDSSVICRYLDRLHPDPPLYPADAYDAARAEWIEEYVDGGVVPVAGPRVFQALVLRPLRGEEPDEEGARAVIEGELPGFFAYLDEWLGDDEFFVGDALSIADLSVASAFGNLRLAGVRPEAASHPRLNAFLGRMHGRPSFQQVIQPLIEAVGKRWVELE